MREGLKDDRYNLRLPPPEQLVPRQLRLGVRERLRADGRIETPLDQRRSTTRSTLLRADRRRGGRGLLSARLARPGARARDRGRLIAGELPDVYVSLSSEVLPQIKEYERVSTTIVNAYVGPVLSRYLARLEARLAEAGYRGPTLIIQSHGGVAPIAEAGRLAAGARAVRPGRRRRRQRLCCAASSARTQSDPVRHGRHQHRHLADRRRPGDVWSSDRRVAGHRIALNSLDIASIGAGGGSIARVDAGGILHVGPESAGAVPGPACYGQGGTAATVTDANLVLGYLDPASFLGGTRRLDPAAAEAAVDGIAAALGIDRVAAARGIHRIVNTTMAEGVRLVSVRRGVDPRRFALFAFGGAAGLHATEIARQLGSVAGHRAARRRGAVGLGHADDRSALRGRPHAISATYGRSTAAR